MNSVVAVDREPQVVHSYDPTTPITVEIVTAFSKAGVNVDKDEQRLFDFVDPEALEALVAESETPTTITTQLWDYPVLINSKSIQIFDKTTSST